MAVASWRAMPFGRSSWLGRTVALSLATIACDGGSAKDVLSNDRATPRSDRRGDGTDGGGTSRGPVAALTLASCTPAGYTLPVRVAGSGPFDVTVDTGSTSLGVASVACSGCDVEPKFSPNDSVVAVGASAKSQYVIGGWSGEVYEGEVALDPKAKASMKFVAIEEHEKFFGRQACGGSTSGGVQGIIGLAPGAGAVAGTNGFLDQLVAESKIADVFATELRDDGGTLWLGGYDVTRMTAEPRYTPLLRGAYTSYAVALTSIRVEGTTVPVASAEHDRTVIDTGASAFLLTRSALEPVAEAIADSARFEELVGEDAAWLDNVEGKSCKELRATKRELDASLPELTMTFGTGADAIEARALATESYLGPNGGQWCSTLLGFEPTGDLRFASIMGAPVLRSNIVVFDREQRRIGFAPHR